MDSPDEKEADTNGGNCHFKTPAAFTACLTCGTMVYAAGYSYITGVMRTLEKRFNLSSTEVNTLMSIMDFTVCILALIVGFAGSKFNKPKMLASLLLFVSVAQVLFLGGPYFYFGHNGKFIGENSTSDFNVSAILCGSETGLSAGQIVNCSVSGENQRNLDGEKVFPLFVIGALLMGVAGSAPGPLGLSYIDENVPSDRAAAHMGFAMAAWPLGPVVGLMLASLCTSLPEDLTGNPDISTNDPRFVGAWWLGFIIIGGIGAFACLPLFFFPKSLNPPAPVKEAKTPTSVMLVLKEFGGDLLQVVKHPQVWSLLVAGIFAIYGILLGGNLPRYMEIHFHLPSYLANITAGIAAALSGSIGSIVGGLIMKRFHMGIVKAAVFYIGILVIVVLCAVGATLMSCPQAPMVGINDHSNDEISSCTSNCSCADFAPYDPVCANGTSYFSACHAGCHDFNTTAREYSECVCTSEGIAAEGECEMGCPLMWPYIILFFTIALVGSAAETPVVIIFLRTVAEDQKSLALGFVSFMNNLLGFVPGPILYGILDDSACLVWQKTCGDTGQCMFYDNEALRIRTHGIPLLFLVGSLISSIITYLLIKRSKRKHAQYEIVS